MCFPFNQLEGAPILSLRQLSLWRLLQTLDKVTSVSRYGQEPCPFCGCRLPVPQAAQLALGPTGVNQHWRSVARQEVGSSSLCS